MYTRLYNKQKHINYMDYLEGTIDKLKDKKILVISFTGMTPHIEASLEISQRLSEKNEISYLHIGQQVSRPSMYSSNIIKRKFQLPRIVKRANTYLNTKKSNSPIRWIESNELSQSINKIFKEVNKDILNKDYDQLSEAKNIKFNNFNIGIGITSTIISMFGDTQPFPLKNNQKKEFREQIISSIKSIIIADIILKKHQYDAIVLLNGRLSCEYAFKQVAKSKNIDIYYHERFYGTTRFFFENYMPHDFPMRKKEFIKMKDHLSDQTINSLGEDFFKRKVKGQGVYEKSYARGPENYLSEELILKINEAKSKHIKILSYYTSSDDEYHVIDKTTNRYPYWKSQIHAISKICDIANELNYYLIVKVHPNLENKSDSEKARWENLANEVKQKGFYWISQKDNDSTYSLIKESDAVVTAGSTVGIEAIYLETPSFSIADCYYDTVIKSIKLCKSPNELRSILKDDLLLIKPKKEESYIYGAWVMGYCPEYKYFVSTSNSTALKGVMKGGYRIASPGIFQKLLNKIKQLRII